MWTGHTVAQLCTAVDRWEPRHHCVMSVLSFQQEAVMALLFFFFFTSEENMSACFGKCCCWRDYTVNLDLYLLQLLLCSSACGVFWWHSRCCAEILFCHLHLGILFQSGNLHVATPRLCCTDAVGQVWGALVAKGMCKGGAFLLYIPVAPHSN
jgi:hypothetical protein